MSDYFINIFQLQDRKAVSYDESVGGIIIKNSIFNSQKRELRNKNGENIDQAQRFLEKIENMHMTTKCKQNLCELITKYFYENYDNCSLYRKDIIINHFMYDFIWSTRIDSSNADYHDISHLENDIISTFTMILYGESSSKAPWWKKNIIKLLKKQN